MTTQEERATRVWYRDPSKLALAGVLGIAAFFLIGGHRAHVLDYLPWLLFLACPLLHLFMHRGHGGHGGHGGQGGHRHGAPGNAPRIPGADSGPSAGKGGQR